jgi:hypothetical protein
VSPLVALGALGTLVSTTTIVPHVLRGMRTKQPGGSPLAWSLGVAGSTIWLVYGIVAGDFLVGAPGLITIPCGLLLAVWSMRAAVVAESVAESVTEVVAQAGIAAGLVAAEPDDAPVFVPDAWIESAAHEVDLPPTLEMPIVA